MSLIITMSNSEDISLAKAAAQKLSSIEFKDEITQKYILTTNQAILGRVDLSRVIFEQHGGNV